MNVAFDTSKISSLFPFHVVFDLQYNILHYGKSLPKLVPSLQVQASFLELFEISRPRTIQNKVENIIKNQQVLFIIKVRNSTLELRGQMFFFEQDNGLILFVAHPIIKDQAILNYFGLTMNDFAIHDQTTDFLFLIQSNKKTMEDLQTLPIKFIYKTKHYKTLPTSCNRQ